MRRLSGDSFSSEFVFSVARLPSSSRHSPSCFDPLSAPHRLSGVFRKRRSEWSSGGWMRPEALAMMRSVFSLDCSPEVYRYSSSSSLISSQGPL